VTVALRDLLLVFGIRTAMILMLMKDDQNEK